MDLLTAVHSKGLTSLHLNPSLPSLALCILQSDGLKHPRPPGITCSLSLRMQTLAQRVSSHLVSGACSLSIFPSSQSDIGLLPFLRPALSLCYSSFMPGLWTHSFHVLSLDGHLPCQGGNTFDTDSTCDWLLMQGIKTTVLYPNL